MIGLTVCPVYLLGDGVNAPQQIQGTVKINVAALAHQVGGHFAIPSLKNCDELSAPGDRFARRNFGVFGIASFALAAILLPAILAPAGGSQDCGIANFGLFTSRDLFGDFRYQFLVGLAFRNAVRVSRVES